MDISTEKELLTHIERIVWDVNTLDEEKVRAIQNLMYQYGSNKDHKTEELFGDDDAHITKRKTE